MTASPHTIGSQQKVAHAAELMQEHGIRHLPVLHGGKLLGVISDRDVKVVEAFRDVDPAEVAIAEAVGQEAYAAAPETPLLDVVETMLAHKYGSAVVMEGTRVVGIFTTVDALRALRDALQP
jgi:acetoin utilization protein AcuB